MLCLNQAAPNYSIYCTIKFFENDKFISKTRNSCCVFVNQNYLNPVFKTVFWWQSPFEFVLTGGEYLNEYFIV